MQLGTNAVYQRARLRPKDTQDYVRARYYWYCDVYSFAKKEQKAADIKLPEGVPESMREQFKELMASMGRGERHKSFEDWLNAKEGIEIIQGEAEDTRAATTVQAYTQSLLTLMVAYSIPGSQTLAAAPAAPLSPPRHCPP